MLGSNSQRLPDPEHGGKVQRWDYVRENERCEGFKGMTNGAINAHTLPLGESLGSLLIGVVRGFGNNVQTAPLTIPFTLSI
jgi:hypothetical protein